MALWSCLRALLGSHVSCIAPHSKVLREGSTCGSTSYPCSSSLPSAPAWQNGSGQHHTKCRAQLHNTEQIWRWWLWYSEGSSPVMALAMLPMHANSKKAEGKTGEASSRAYPAWSVSVKYAWGPLELHAYASNSRQSSE